MTCYSSVDLLASCKPTKRVHTATDVLECDKEFIIALIEYILPVSGPIFNILYEGNYVLPKACNSLISFFLFIFGKWQFVTLYQNMFYIFNFLTQPIDMCCISHNVKCSPFLNLLFKKCTKQFLKSGLILKKVSDPWYKWFLHSNMTVLSP